MPTFRYTTMENGGKESSGSIEAPDIDTAAANLRKGRRLITSLKEVSKREDKSKDSFFDDLLSYLSLVTSTDITILFRQLSVLITAGVTLSRSLEILEKQVRKRRLRNVINRVHHDIEEGSTFADALKKHPRVFIPLISNIIEAGETGGLLDVVLERIADYLEERSAFRTQLITSFIYPTIVIIMTIVVISFLVGFVIPKFEPLVKSRGGSLPWNTQLLLDISKWFETYWKYIAVLMGLGAISMYLLYLTKKGRYRMDRIKMSLPVFGPIFSYSVIVQFSRNLSSLLTSGVSILESLRTVRNTLGNEVAMKVMDDMEKRIARGESLSSPLREARNVFPPIVAEMVAVGEETGGVDTTLNLVADIHEKLLQTYVRRMNTLIEPAIILILGCIVGFTAWGLIAGILTMYRF